MPEIPLKISVAIICKKARELRIIIIIIIIIVIIFLLNNEQILLTTMLTIKILFTIDSLEKKKKLFIQNTIYNSCRFKKHLI